MILKKFIKGLISFVLIIPMVSIAFAGQTLDRGTVEGIPPVGEVNYIAWINVGSPPPVYPYQIQTEDSFNEGLGTDNGYALWDGVPNWALFAVNFSDPMVSAGNPITIMFGGLGNSSGKIWRYDFNFVVLPSITIHGEAPLIATNQPCPVITYSNWNGITKEIQWSAPPGKYHIYESLLGSDAGNNASNGRYNYVATVDTTTNIGSYSEVIDWENWHIVVTADSTGAINGCHSEEAGPTAVAVSGLQARVVDEYVVVEWDTHFETDLTGFNLYRATTADGPRQLLNPALIQLKSPGEPSGNHYDYQDLGVNRNQTYFYWLELLQTSSPAETIGPAQVTLEGFKIFLPYLVNGVVYSR